jgi:hypothetical protein
MLSSAFAVLAVVAFWAARPPFLAIGIGLIIVAAGWLAIRRDVRGAGAVVVLGNVLGVAVGLYGLWGITVISERCPSGAPASLAMSWPEGACDSQLLYWLMAGYLVSIGILSAISLVAVWRRS